MPFTTPMLAGARVRSSDRRGIEFVLPDTPGSRGVYVVHWRGVRTLCQPTVHDTILAQRLAQLASVSPASVRDAALDVALEGYAGRAAMAAARTVIDQDRLRQRLTHGLLVRTLAARFGVCGERAAAPPGPADGAGGRTWGALDDLAAPFGLSAASLDAALAALAVVLAPIGLAPIGRDGRVARLLGRLEQARIGLAEWLGDPACGDTGGLGGMVMVAVALARDCGESLLAAARPAVADPVAAVRRWIADRAGMQASVLRCDWLLDGWERPALLFLSAGPGAARRAALLEMAMLIPVLPAEVLAWTDIPIHPDTLWQSCHVTICDDSWRTGGPAFGLIARNESLLAMRV